MKLNWGHSIIIAFVLFIGFILFFVIQSHQFENKHELVSEDYYKEELQYQTEIDALNSAKSLEPNVTITKTNNGFKVVFPEEFNNQNTTGSIKMMRPSNKVFDFESAVEITDGVVYIENEKLLEGNWRLRLEFTKDNTLYLIKKDLQY